MNLNDTGILRLEGDLRRARELSDIPVKMNLSWEKAQLGQFSGLLVGHDRGWRGGLSGDAQLTGTLANLHVIATAQLDHFRRFDINRDSMPQLRAKCLGDYTKSALNLKCDAPVETGGLLITARWLEAAPRDYSFSMVANHVPLSWMATLARHARRSLPDDLTATGDFNAAFGFHSHNGIRNWHGAGMTSHFLLQTSVADKPFPVSSIKFHIGMAETPTVLAARKAASTSQAPAPQSDSLTVDGFSVQLGPSTLEIQGNLDGGGYRVTAKGMVPLERLLALGRAAGFQADAPNFTASAVVDFNVTGPWANFAPPHVRGTAHVQNLTAWIPGVKDRLLLSQADIQLTDAALVLSHINGQFEHSPVAFTGTVTSPWTCPGDPPCPMEFDLHSDSLAVTDVAGLLGLNDKGWNLPFFSDSSGKLPVFRAQGTLAADKLTVAQLPLEKFTAHLEVDDHALLVDRIVAKLGGGSVDGNWKADWTSAPRYTATGTLAGVAMDHLGISDPLPPNVELVTGWVTGKANVKYAVRFDGKTPQEMLSSASGPIEFAVTNGNSRALLLEASKPLKFQSLQGSFQLEKQVLKVLPSKFRAENRIYEVSGTVSLADNQAKLKVSNNASRWEVTGALDKPQISSKPVVAETRSVGTR